MLDTNTHCQMLTEHIRDRNATITDAFKSFVSTFTAIVGGSVALKASAYPVTASTVTLANFLVLLSGLAAIIIIADNYRAWFQYRLVLANVAGATEGGQNIVPPPRFWTSARVEFLMVAVIVVTCLLFLIYNPLRN